MIPFNVSISYIGDAGVTIKKVFMRYAENIKWTR